MEDNTKNPNPGSEQNSNNTEHDRMGNNYNPNDASGVRSGGTVDMDNQTVGGAGSNNAHRPGAGSGLTPKHNVTGSDFDGQNSTS